MAEKAMKIALERGICGTCRARDVMLCYGLGKTCSLSCERTRLKTLVHLEKIRPLAWEARLGTHHSIETKKLISRSRSGKAMGSDNPKWNGGIGIYRKIIDIRECFRCGESQKRLVVHHKDRDRHNNSHTNLEVLCDKCHCARHKHYNRWLQTV